MVRSRAAGSSMPGPLGGDVKIKEFVTSKLRLARSAPRDWDPLVTATYRLEVPRGWQIHKSGSFVLIRGPRGELLYVSSGTSSWDASELARRREASRRYILQSV